MYLDWNPTVQSVERIELSKCLQNNKISTNIFQPDCFHMLNNVKWVKLNRICSSKFVLDFHFIPKCLLNYPARFKFVISNTRIILFVLPPFPPSLDNSILPTPHLSRPPPRPRLPLHPLFIVRTVLGSTKQELSKKAGVLILSKHFKEFYHDHFRLYFRLMFL